MYTCDVYPPRTDRQVDMELTEKSAPCVGQGTDESSNSSSMTTNRNPCKLVINIPTPGDMSSSTSVSSDTWPGVCANDSAESATNVDDQNLPSLNPPAAGERRSTSSVSSRNSTTFTHSLKFDSRFESGNLRAASQVSFMIVHVYTLN